MMFDFCDEPDERVEALRLDAAEDAHSTELPPAA
jgi:hypothetical protein